MNILCKVNSLKNVSKCDIIRCMSVQVQPQQRTNESKYQSFQEEWHAAKPYSAVPGPSKLGLIRAFLPGGKYYKMRPIDMLDKAKDEYGIIYKIPGMFGRTDVVVSLDPNDLEKVFRTEGPWPQRPPMQAVTYFRTVEKADFYRKSPGLIVEQGERWAQTRSVVNPVMMQPRTVTQYIKPIDSVGVDLIERMKKVRDPKTLELPADFDNDLQHWALESTGIIALDTRLGLLYSKSTNNPDAERLIKNIRRFFQLMYDLEIKPNLSHYIATPAFKEMMQVQSELQDITSRYVDMALDRLKSESSDRPDHEKGVLERLVAFDKTIALVMATDMLMVGVDTTTAALLGCIYLLAKNPKKQKKLFEELKTIMPTKDTPLTKDNMLELPYLRACLKESHRIHPVIGLNDRISNQDLVLSGYQIPKGSNVMVPSQILQINERNFPQPKEFIPERFLRDQTKNTECPSAKTAHPFIYLPFGFGPRICVGKRIAEMEIEVVLSRIFRNFQVEYHYKDIEFEPSTINVPKGEFKFKLIDINE